MPEFMDERYRALRRTTDTWQSQYINQEEVSSGGSGTPTDPATSLAIDRGTGDQPQPPPRKERTVDTPEMQAIRTQFQDELAKMQSGETAVGAVGKAGRKAAEAIHPGIVAAGRALGLDETGADAMATGFVEFMAGLPGEEDGDQMAGFETALAALPMVGMAIKGGKAVAKIASKGKPIYEMSLDELSAAEKAASKREANIVSDAFGLDADEVNKALRVISTSNDEGKAVAAEKQLEALMKKHGVSQEDADRIFYGIREKEIPAERYREFHRERSQVDIESPQALGKSLARAITDVGAKTDPSQMTSAEQMAYAKIQEAFRYARSQGWDLKEISNIALQSATSRFSDPADAAFMLQRFMQASKPGILADERGSMTLGGGRGKASATLGGIHPDDLVKIQQHKTNFEQSVKAFNKQLSADRRGVRTDEQVLVDSISPEAMTVEQLLNLKPGSVAKDSDVVKIKKTFRDLAEPVRLAAVAASQNPRDAKSLMAVLEQIGNVRVGLTKLAGVYAETGRSQRLLSSKLPIQDAAKEASEERVRISDPYIQQWLDFFKQQAELDAMGAPAVTIEKVLSALAEMKSHEQIVQLVKAMDKPSKFDMFIEYWINGLLSGPQTHATNMISNAATQAIGIPERALASFFSRSVRPSETTAMIGGVVEGFGDAMRLAWKAFKTEETQFGNVKMEVPKRAITGDALELAGVPGRAVDLLGSMIRLPGRALMAEDDFFKGVAFRSELRALARRESIRQVQDAQLSGAAARRAMEDIERNILAHPEQFESVMDDARKYAAYVTFTKDLGQTGQKWQMALSTPIGRIVAPFVRTPVNIFKFTGERTPFALASRAVRDEIAAGGERRALALAKISLGSMIMAYSAKLAADGTITGGGPSDPNLLREKQQTGWQSYSIHVGDTYYKYGRLEPISSLLGAAADAADLMGQLSEEDSAEFASALVVALSRNVSEKTFVKGLAGSLDAITSRDIHKVEHYFSKELPTLLPFSTASGQIARTIDPTMRAVSLDHSYGMMAREMKFAVDSFKAKVPGYSKKLRPRRNLFGEPILLEGGLGPDMISPVYTTQEKTAPISQEIVRLKLSVNLPPKQIDGVPLSDDEYDAYQRLAGGMPILADMTLRERLAEEMKSEIYKNASSGPDGGKAERIKSWIAIYRQRAAQIMGNADLSKQYLGQDFPELRAQIEMKREQAMTKFNAPVGAR